MQDVDGGHIDVANQRHGQVPEELRVVFQYQRTRVGDAEGIPQAVCAHIVQDILGVAVTGIRNGNTLAHYVGAYIIHFDVIAHQRVHAVHRHEFFCQGVGHVIVVGRAGAHEAAQCVVNHARLGDVAVDAQHPEQVGNAGDVDRKSTRLNSSHVRISYA